MALYTLPTAGCFEAFAQFPWLRDRLVEAGSLWLQVRLTVAEFDTLVAGGVNVY